MKRFKKSSQFLLNLKIADLKEHPCPQSSIRLFEIQISSRCVLKPNHHFQSNSVCYFIVYYNFVSCSLSSSLKRKFTTFPLLKTILFRGHLPRLPVIAKILIQTSGYFEFNLPRLFYFEFNLPRLLHLEFNLLRLLYLEFNLPRVFWTSRKLDKNFFCSYLGK